MTNGIVLDARLGALAAWIEPCGCVADIGADHGRLGAWLLQNRRAGHVQFLDISLDSLQKARRLIEKLGLGERASFSVGDGAQALVMPADAVVIAGMGGQLIADIIERGADALRVSRLIMQPNVAAMQLRERLMRLGFRIERERIVRAQGRMYVVLSARDGSAEYTKAELLVGPCLLAQGDPLLAQYAARQYSIAQKALAGARWGGAEGLSELEWECSVWEGIAHGGQCSADL